MAKRSRKAESAREQPTRHFVWTNRANVLAMCAAGVIWPSSLYRKHYPDVSDLTTGRLPVFVDRLPAQLNAALSSDGALFDVAIEVESVAIRESAFFDGPGWSLKLVNGPIPWAAVKKVHVRTKADADDLRAREFADLPANAWAIEVSPDRWDDHTMVSDLLEQLAALGAGPLASSPLVEADRFAGGLALMRRVMPRAFACELGLAQLCSREVRTHDLPKLLPAVPPWLQRLLNFARPNSGADDLDQHLLRAALHVVGKLHVEAGADPRQLAGAIADEAAGAGGPAIAEDVRKWESYARRVSGGDATPSSLDDYGSEVRRALLLFLLRIEPGRMIKAGHSSLKPGGAVHSIAAFVSGFAACYSRLERDIKGDLEAHKAMSLVIVNRLRQLTEADERDEEVQLQLLPSDEEPHGSVRMRTTVTGFVLSERRTEPGDDMKKLYFQAKSAGVELLFDPIWSRFTVAVDVGDETPHTVFVESGMRSWHNQPSVRFSSDCLLAGGRSAKALPKTELLALLERNSDLDMHCRFGVSRTSGRLQVVAHQLIETLDVPELKAHLDAVARTAAEVAALMSGSPARDTKSDD